MGASLLLVIISSPHSCLSRASSDSTLEATLSDTRGPSFPSSWMPSARCPRFLRAVGNRRLSFSFSLCRHGSSVSVSQCVSSPARPSGTPRLLPYPGVAGNSTAKGPFRAGPCAAQAPWPGAARHRQHRHLLSHHPFHCLLYFPDYPGVGLLTAGSPGSNSPRDSRSLSRDACAHPLSLSAEAPSKDLLGFRPFLPCKSSFAALGIKGPHWTVGHGRPGPARGRQSGSASCRPDGTAEGV